MESVDENAPTIFYTNIDEYTDTSDQNMDQDSEESDTNDVSVRVM